MGNPPESRLLQYPVRYAGKRKDESYRMPNFQNIVSELQSQRNQLQAELQTLDEAIRAVERLDGRGTRNGASRALGSSRHVSAAGRARIAAAQRARWAKAKEAQSGKRVREVSRAARKRMAAAQRARWSKIKRAA
jgi:hypothetical protein